MLKRKTIWMALIFGLALVAAACGGDDSGDDGGNGGTTATTAATTTTPGGTNGGDVSQWGLPIIDPFEIPGGDIGIAGSSTVFPLSTAIVSKLKDEGGPEYVIQSVGSGGGFERFCVQGETDISNASRPIKDSEVESCQAIGRDPIEIRVGTDALSVVISADNYFAQELTLAEIATAFSAPTGATWDTVNPSFPAHPIQTFSPGADSGTFDYFNEVVFEEADPPPILGSGVVQIVGEDDNITVRGVSEDGCTEGDLSTTCAIGYFGFAFFQANADILQAVAVDGVSPGVESVNAGTYPISRPLYMYTDPGVVADKPQVAQFIAYYLNNVNEVIGDVGYFPAPDTALQEAADAIAAAAGF